MKPKYIPIELNKKPVEEVRYIENETFSHDEIINTFEERQSLINNKSKLSPAARNKIVKRHGSDYLSERAFNHDIALLQMYGPGFWDDIKGFVKPVATGALVVASVFPPTAPIAVPITLTVGTAGLATKGLGHLVDNDDMKEVGMDLMEIAVNTKEGQDAAQGGDLVAKTYYNHYKNRK